MPGKGTGAASPEKLSTQLRRTFVFEKRLSGLTYQEIADVALEELGAEALPGQWDKREVWQDINTVLVDMQENLAVAVEGVRQMELERLDRLLTALWDSACGGNGAAVDRILKIMQRRADLLGLDKNRLTVDMEARGAVAFYLPEIGATVPLPNVQGHTRVGVCPLPALAEGEILDGKIEEEKQEEEYAVETERRLAEMEDILRREYREVGEIMDKTEE